MKNIIITGNNSELTLRAYEIFHALAAHHHWVMSSRGASVDVKMTCQPVVAKSREYAGHRVVDEDKVYAFVYASTHMDALAGKNGRGDQWSAPNVIHLFVDQRILNDEDRLDKRLLDLYNVLSAAVNVH